MRMHCIRSAFLKPLFWNRIKEPLENCLLSNIIPHLLRTLVLRSHLLGIKYKVDFRPVFGHRKTPAFNQINRFLNLFQFQLCFGLVFSSERTFEPFSIDSNDYVKWTGGFLLNCGKFVQLLG